MSAKATTSTINTMPARSSRASRHRRHQDRRTPTTMRARSKEHLYGWLKHCNPITSDGLPSNTMSCRLILTSDNPAPAVDCLTLFHQVQKLDETMEGLERCYQMWKDLPEADQKVYKAVSQVQRSKFEGNMEDNWCLGSDATDPAWKLCIIWTDDGTMTWSTDQERVEQMVYFARRSWPEGCSEFTISDNA